MDFDFDLKIYFIYFLVLRFKKRKKKLLENSEIEIKLLSALLWNKSNLCVNEFFFLRIVQ